MRKWQKVAACLLFSTLPFASNAADDDVLMLTETNGSIRYIVPNETCLQNPTTTTPYRGPYELLFRGRPIFELQSFERTGVHFSEKAKRDVPEFSVKYIDGASETVSGAFITCASEHRHSFGGDEAWETRQGWLPLYDKIQEIKRISYATYRRNLEGLQRNEDEKRVVALSAQRVFQDKLKIGDSTSCGMVIDTRKDLLVEVQTSVGNKWFKRSDLAMPGRGQCVIP